MRNLIEGLLLPSFQEGFNDDGMAQAPHDSAVLEINGLRVAFTTDSYVVSPLFFPGGDIGQLAVYGTVNDLAMAGARPLYLSCGLILEEGISLDMLERVVRSMQRAATTAGVRIVTGDTKVVDRGKARRDLHQYGRGRCDTPGDRCPSVPHRAGRQDLVER